MKLDEQVARKYLALKESAKARGKPFSLTLTSIRNLKKAKKCYYSGVKLTTREGDNQRTIDCVDPSKGYVQGNVVACSRRMNELKRDMTLSEVNLTLKGIERKLNA